MKKSLIIAVVVCFVIPMVLGCEKKSSKDNSLLPLLLLSAPANSYSGTPENIAAGSQCTGATSLSLTGVQQMALAQDLNTAISSKIANDDMAELVKDNMQTGIMELFAKKVIKAGEKKASTVPIDSTYIKEMNYSSLNGGKMLLVPNISYKGTVTGSKSSTSQSYVLSVTATGTMTMTFTNYQMFVFDVYGFIKNNAIAFKTITLSGIVNSTINYTINENVNGSMTATAPIIMVTAAKTDGTISSDSSMLTITADGATTTNNFSITSKEKKDITTDVAYDMVGTQKYTFNAASGTATYSMTGTINGAATSFSYVIGKDHVSDYYKKMYEKMNEGR